MKNARFWTYINGGPVKLTLEPGQAAYHHHGERTDEGWASESTQWTHEDGGVRREWTTDGRDCDGRLTRHGADFCPLDQLHDLINTTGEDSTIHWPDWQRESAGQRDEYAEAAGY